MSDLKVDLPNTTNRILSELPPEEYERLSSHLEPIRLSVGDTLYYPHDPVTHVYFLNRGSVSSSPPSRTAGGSKWASWATRGCLA